MDSTNFTPRITPVAVEDLREITDYIARQLGNPEAAEKLWLDIIEGVDNAARFPFSTPVLRNEHISTHEYRKILVRNFVAVYQIAESEKEIRILRVFYAPSNLIELF